MLKRFLTILLLIVCFAPFSEAKNPFKKQMPVVTGVPSAEPLEIDSEYNTGFVYFDEGQAKQEAKEVKAKAKLKKKHEKLVAKKEKLEKRLQKSEQTVEKSKKYIELLNRPIERPSGSL